MAKGLKVNRLIGLAVENGRYPPTQNGDKLQNAPFSGSGLTSWGNGERICSVFLTQVIGHQQILPQFGIRFCS